MAAIRLDEDNQIKNIEHKIFVFLPNFQIAALYQHTAVESIAKIAALLKWDPGKLIFFTDILESDDVWVKIIPESPVLVSSAVLS